MAVTVGRNPAARPIGADRRRLAAWYEPRRRAYPWRTDPPDPYRVLVSEVMLQQTQAPRVAPIFEAFVARFRDVRTLAAAPRADVIRAWAGLGYDRRAVALHAAAGSIVSQHSGEVPPDPAVLRTLPGIGPYTASAVASIAFGAPFAAVDTNVRRIAARYLLGREADEVAPATLAEAAEEWIDVARPDDWNQALMDLGREVCRPRPRCDACPLTACGFRALGRSGRPASRRQPAYEGSLRQVRGRVLAILRERPSATIPSLVDRLDLPAERVEEAIAGLSRDGLVVRARGRVRLPA